MKQYEVAGQVFRTRKAALVEARLQNHAVVIKVIEGGEVLQYLEVAVLPLPPPVPAVPLPVTSPIRALQDAVLAEATRLDYSMHTVIFPGVTTNITLGLLSLYVYPEWEGELRTLLTSLQGRVYNPNVLR